MFFGGNVMRIGHGYDVHQLVEGRDLILGGVKIPYEKGLLGHSDADVLIHALCDALLGAAALRDIGYHFPPVKGNEFENIDSKILLRRVMQMIREAGYELGNCDCTICAEVPKINPHIPAMTVCLAEVMGVSEQQISIKATTTERLGFVGRKEGIAAQAVVLITCQ
jgi:2-C-methyl-D-erythritol 2,4-cyclodiphosphate synthase